MLTYSPAQPWAEGDIITRSDGQVFEVDANGDLCRTVQSVVPHSHDGDDVNLTACEDGYLGVQDQPITLTDFVKKTEACVNDIKNGSIFDFSISGNDITWTVNGNPKTVTVPQEVYTFVANPSGGTDVLLNGQPHGFIADMDTVSLPRTYAPNPNGGTDVMVDGQVVYTIPDNDTKYALIQNASGDYDLVDSNGDVQGTVNTPADKDTTWVLGTSTPNADGSFEQCFTTTLVDGSTPNGPDDICFTVPGSPETVYQKCSGADLTPSDLILTTTSAITEAQTAGQWQSSDFENELSRDEVAIADNCQLYSRAERELERFIFIPTEAVDLTQINVNTVLPDLVKSGSFTNTTSYPVTPVIDLNAIFTIAATIGPDVGTTNMILFSWGSLTPAPALTNIAFTSVRTDGSAVNNATRLANGRNPSFERRGPVVPAGATLDYSFGLRTQLQQGDISATSHQATANGVPSVEFQRSISGIIRATTLRQI